MTPEERARALERRSCYCDTELGAEGSCRVCRVRDAIRAAVREALEEAEEFARKFQDRGMIGDMTTCGCGKLIAAAIRARKEAKP